jgi:hypothetical protein
MEEVSSSSNASDLHSRNVSSGTSTILTGVFREIPQFLQANTLGHDRLLPHPLQFTIIQSFDIT